MSEEDLQYYQILLIVGGLVASASFGSQLLMFKHVSKNHKDTFSIGFGFLFACGLIGLVSLGIEVLKNPDEIQELPIESVIGPAIIGVLTAMAIVLANIAAGIGIAGISNSIIHCSLVIVTLFNYFVFKQSISFE